MRVNRLSENKLRTFKRFGFINCIVASLFISTACNNINSNLSRNPTSTIFQTDPNAAGNGGAFQLTSVAPDLASPGTVYDLIGQNNEFDTYCGGTLGACQCEYTFIQPGVGSQTVSSAVTYQESNLLRCPNSVPSGITSFDTRVTVVAGATGATAPAAGTGAISYSSNTITVNLSTNGAFAGSTSYIDLTSASSYVPVQRFQCRKREFIPNPMDNLIIDPFQSQDPAVIYPFNFYTTNISESLLRMQQLPDQKWECSLAANKDRTVQWWANPNVFSTQACTSAFCNGDGYLMYPTTALSGNKIPVTPPSPGNPGSKAVGKRRGTFSLASIPYGVFQIPVKAAVAPLDYVKANYSIVGYGAKPIPNTNGSSSCPAITLPPKSTWVKLWNFRATDITAPKIVTSSQSITNAVVACDTHHGQNIFPSCEATYPSGAPGGPGYSNSFGNPLDFIQTLNFTGSDPMASRVLLLASPNSTAQTSACYNSRADQWTDPTAASLNGVNHNGKDQWTPSPFAFSTATPTPISIDDIVGFPFNLYQNAKSAGWTKALAGPPNPNRYEWFSSTPAGAYAVPSVAPADFQNQLTTQPLAPDNFTDQLFITTDPAVDDSQMRNGSSAVAEFIPSTYRSVQDCLGPTTAGCTANRINWGVNVKEVGTPTTADLYPLCVLQFYD